MSPRATAAGDGRHPDDSTVIDNWLTRARAALAVPDTVLDARDEPDQPLVPGDWKGCGKMYSMTNFTDDPEAVLRWRDEMADLIEACDFHPQL